MNKTRDKIVIFSHNAHSFLKNEIYYASRTFKKVIVIAPYDKELAESIVKLENVKEYLYTNQEFKKIALRSTKKIFRLNNLFEIIEVLKNKLMTKKYLKVLIHYFALEEILSHILFEKIKIQTESANEYVLYSAWYSGTAFSISQIKKKNPDFLTVTLAHSYEIDLIKSPFAKVLFRSQYHKYLDRISFISKNVYEEYIHNVAEPLKLNNNNTGVNYLGARKILQGNNPIVRDNVLKIVSCSHVVPVKRVELIFKALDSMQGKSIEWTHIGTGPMINELEQLIRNKKNQKLKVSLLGAIENKKIHELYLNNPYDIFINLSTSEGIPVTIMEALAYGIPVIATDVGGNSEIVKESFGRILSSNPSLNEINKSIMELSSEDKINQEVRVKAIETFDEKFNADKIRENFFKKIKEGI